MARLKLFFIFIVFTLFQTSCNTDSKKVSGNSANNQTKEKSDLKTFSGIFFGITPCADCPGIESTVAFNPDSTFIETMKYQERNSSFSDTGRWNISDKIITVSFPRKSTKRFFLIKSDSAIAMLDADKKEIEGALANKYILKRKD